MMAAEFAAPSRDVAIVSVAQSKHERAIVERNEVELIQPVIQQAMEQIGAHISEIDFVCSGSSDYLAGQAFSFVMTLDAVGAWPPKSESHVEMDGAWALYEAWLKIQAGHADTALVYGYGKSSPGDLPSVLSRQLDPYYYQPLWPTSVALAGLQARAMLDAGKITEAEMAQIAFDSREAAKANPNAQLQGSAPVEELLAAPRIADPLRRHDVAPITDGGCAIVLAAGDAVAKWADRPAYIRGIDHRIDSHNFGARDLTDVPSARLAAERAGVANGPVDVAELHAPFTHQHKMLVEALGLGDDVDVNPSGGALAANPMMGAGLIRIGEVANRIMSGEATRGVAHATSGHLLQQNLVAVLEGA
ncbi:MAG: thiolase domain-containing protein [Microthrixaceae bacterium]|nr:thiolase domain-containing protein [Microthrixaceae bacterium]